MDPLSHECKLLINDFPDRWVPLLHPYDPDLPLYPLYYFHVLSPSLARSSRPGPSDRAFGYISNLSVLSSSQLTATLVCNKNLDDPANAEYRALVDIEVRERLGIRTPVTFADVENAFSDEWATRNAVLKEMWYRVVQRGYGDRLPFGRFWDATLGLARFVASFYTDGRKDEIIQTHYFASKFGEPIQSSGSLPPVAYYLLPTIEELTDTANPLDLFPNFSLLLRAADQFRASSCGDITVAGITLTKFNNTAGRMNQAKAQQFLDGMNASVRPAAQECFNAFGKHGDRWIRFLLLLLDLRYGRLKPGILTSAQLGDLYDGLGGTFQSPKVLAIYAQQCFGNSAAMPVDTWIGTFLKWPLNIRSRTSELASVFALSDNLGRVERLLWIAGQARKVHSSACDDILWCVKKGPADEQGRGANPLGCAACRSSLRAVCPAYAAIKDMTISFNNEDEQTDFKIKTNLGNSTSPNQRFVSCVGVGQYGETTDIETVRDRPRGYQIFPVNGHSGENLTVDEFVQKYEV